MIHIGGPLACALPAVVDQRHAAADEEHEAARLILLVAPLLQRCDPVGVFDPLPEVAKLAANFPCPSAVVVSEQRKVGAGLVRLVRSSRNDRLSHGITAWS